MHATKIGTFDVSCKYTHSQADQASCDCLADDLAELLADAIST